MPNTQKADCSGCTIVLNGEPVCITYYWGAVSVRTHIELNCWFSFVVPFVYDAVIAMDCTWTISKILTKHTCNKLCYMVTAGKTTVCCSLRLAS